MTSLVFDIGGTNTRIATTDGVKLEEIEKFATPSPSECLERIKSYIGRRGVTADKAVGGVAGSVNNGRVVAAKYLQEWEGFDLASAMRETCGISNTRLFNDAELAGIGEAVRGAGREKKVVAYITVSTGVGGALIVDGVSVPHLTGEEPGKQIIDCENMRTLESFVGGRSLEEELNTAPEDLSQEVFDNRMQMLAVGMYNVVRLWSPEVLIMGGSLMNEDKGYKIDALSAEINKINAGAVELPIIIHSSLGDSSGLYGAASLSLSDA